MSPQKVTAAKRRSSAKQTRGDLHSPCDVSAATKTTTIQRTLGVRIDLDLNSEDDRKLFQRLRDLGWQAASYRNGRMRRLWAQAMGWRVDPEKGDRNDITKQGRQDEKGELSGAAYSAAEREVDAVWKKEVKRILAGAPLPNWRADSALSVRADGVKIEWDGKRFIAVLSAQSKDCEGGCRLRLPVSKNTATDQHQSEILHGMVAGTVPANKATVTYRLKRRRVILRIAYSLERELPPMGKRVATLGPIRDDSIKFRTETQTKDYTSRLKYIFYLGDEWEKIRRRISRQIAWRSGHSRTKRILNARKSPQDAIDTHLDAWSRDMVRWAATQGVGIIKIVGIDTGDWPAYRFMQKVKYKAEEAGMTVSEEVDVSDKSTERALGAEIKKRQRKVSRRRKAVRELEYQLTPNGKE